ncbi:MAG: hypothetical protein V9E91_12565 [Burkholderiaceae bacterium]
MTFVWQEVDKVRVHGKTQVLSIYTPMARSIAENTAIEAQNTDDIVNQKYEKDELRYGNWLCKHTDCSNGTSVISI